MANHFALPDAGGELGRPDPRHTSVADCIKAAGYDRMALDYLARPSDRPRIVRCMALAMARNPNIGTDRAEKFSRLAFHAIARD